MNRSSSRCLFLAEDEPISPNATGAAAFAYSHLELLAHSGYQINLVLLSDPRRTGPRFADLEVDQPGVWQQIRSWCNQIRSLELSIISPHKTALLRVIYSIYNPGGYLYPELTNRDTVFSFRKLISEIDPDFIWAEHLVPATLTQQTVDSLPSVYSHADWRWRIKKLRSGVKAKEWKRRYRFWLSRRHEIGLVRWFSGCVSGSASEAVDIMQFGAKLVGYFPTTYTPVDLPEREVFETPRIVHLGGMGATANRLGLERFFEVVWPVLCEDQTSVPEIWVIGSLDGASPSLLAAMKEAGVICTGFVEDLKTVLRPGDIHIIPWEYNTGTRTRIPLVLNYGQVLVSTRAAAACISELKHRENCLLVDDLPQMAGEIRSLIENDEFRCALADEGRKTFLEFFTREALQPRFNKFLETLQ